VDRATDLYLGGSWFELLPGTRLTCGAYLWNISAPYTRKCLDIATNYAQTYRFSNYSLLTLLFDTVYSELQPELLNELYIKIEFVPVHDMKAYWGNRSMAPVILNLGTRRE